MAIWIRIIHSPLEKVGGWATPLKNMKVNGKDDIPYNMEQIIQMFQTTYQITIIPIVGLYPMKTTIHITINHYMVTICPY